MRILDQDNDEARDSVILYLTEAEARELRDALGVLLEHPTDSHEHITSEGDKKEITICIYDLQDLGQFDERSKRLIETDR